MEHKLPPRMRILKEAFEEGWNLEQVNENLEAAGCERLYARSIYEAGLIYAFSNGLSHESWKELYGKYKEETRDTLADVQGIGIWHGAVTLRDLEQYVRDNADEELRTAMLTRKLEKNIRESSTEKDFMDFMRKNRDKFSAVREKARYYFCKYLYLYIEEKCNNYYACCEETERERKIYGRNLPEEQRGVKEKLALEDLALLKTMTGLKDDVTRLRARIPLAEKKKLLQNATLSPGGIFDEYNYYYFGYVSIDWVEILFEFYGFFEDWPEEERVRIAHSLGYCSANPNEEEKRKAFLRIEKLSREEKNRERELDQEYERQQSEQRERQRKRLYQKGRSGEKYFRQFLKGERDVNREFLISFLLFVQKRAKLDADNKITIPRLNRILDGCGFFQLRPDYEFDVFAMEFLRARNPSEVLEKRVEAQVILGKNFYLYKIYRDSYNHQEEILRYILQRGEEGSENESGKK